MLNFNPSKISIPKLRRGRNIKSLADSLSDELQTLKISIPELQWSAVPKP